MGWLGRAAALDRVLGQHDFRHQEKVSGVSFYGRGLLGFGVGVAAAGLRLLLRQDALRPLGTWRRREHPASPWCRYCISKQAAPVYRESRRATCGCKFFFHQAAGGGFGGSDSSRNKTIP